MPQMMPLWWTLMIITTISMLLFVIIFIYFLYLPNLTLVTNNKPLYFYWNWLW